MKADASIAQSCVLQECSLGITVLGSKYASWSYTFVVSESALLPRLVKKYAVFPTHPLAKSTLPPISITGRLCRYKFRAKVSVGYSAGMSNRQSFLNLPLIY